MHSVNSKHLITNYLFNTNAPVSRKASRAQLIMASNTVNLQGQQRRIRGAFLRDMFR